MKAKVLYRVRLRCGLLAAVRTLEGVPGWNWHGHDAAGDYHLWDRFGFWREDGREHPCDIVAELPYAAAGGDK